jgi:CheY-like chemotaxis protein/anti-sigma regulatory factor (Ser/Thr protein kinase)
LADAQGITIGYVSGDESPHVRADRQRLKQVLLNLLSNSVKYNRTDGTVEITLYSTNEAVRLEVADTGIGMSDDELAKLFQPFERLGADLRQIEGTGLGLVLSKGLVEAMGGNIGATSTTRGTTFWIELEAAAAPMQSLERDLAGVMPDEHADAHTATVLYIEDNVSNLKLIARILEQRPDVSLLSAMQGSLGLELAQQHRPDLILLDLHLPDTDGERVLTQLRAHPATNQTPVVVLSADATQGRIQRLLDQGANEYLSKPINVQRLLEILDTYVRERATT